VHREPNPRPLTVLVAQPAAKRFAWPVRSLGTRALPCELRLRHPSALQQARNSYCLNSLFGPAELDMLSLPMCAVVLCDESAALVACTARHQDRQIAAIQAANRTTHAACRLNMPPVEREHRPVCMRGRDLRNTSARVTGHARSPEACQRGAQGEAACAVQCTIWLTGGGKVVALVLWHAQNTPAGPGTKGREDLAAGGRGGSGGQVVVLCCAKRTVKLIAKRNQ